MFGKEIHECTPIFMGHVDMSGEGISMRSIGDPEAGSDPRGHLWVTSGVYLCAGKPPLADMILSHPPDLTRCDSVIGLAVPAMSGHIQYRGTASGDLYIRISGINRVFYHNVSVIFQPSVLIVNVSATVSRLAILR